ncbi:MAG TPA: alpha/beta hydrolase [Propionicimonas sp.]|nr:alpha/beta hydrolase [Propionicimonas sp.]
MTLLEKPAVAVAGAAALVAGVGVAGGLWTPRGPVTVAESLATMLLAAVAGVGAGWLLRSRLGVLALPILYAVAFEVTRLPAQGPTVDMLNVGGIYGWLAAVSGRGVHGLLVFPALVAGGLVGGAIARSRRSGRLTGGRRVLEAASIGLAALAVVAVGITVLIPARTEPIRGADGTVVPGGIAELTRVPVTGGALKVLIRGTSDSNPILLFLAGGPGGSEFGAMRRHGQALEQDFVVATLDQRGTGSSYDQLEPLATHTLANAVTDVIEISDYLRTRFGQQQVHLVGQSWGTIIGVLAAEQRPDLFATFVGVGQMVDIAETDRIFYDDTLAWARESGNSAFVAQLEAAGPPPYADLLDYPMVFAHEQEVYGYDHSVNAEGAGQMVENLPVSEYSPLDTVNIVRGLLDTFSVLYPQLQDLDLRRSAAELKVPVYIVEGRFEPRGRKDLARDWFDHLKAPEKRWVEFETSGHRPLFEQPAEFAQLMRTIAADR